ncbi:MAG: 50S ribosomal protein L4 [Myxococcota bacterium]
MPTLKVFDQNGKEQNTIELSDDVFAAKSNDHLMWLVIKAQLAKKRSGTHKTKGRSEVRGGGKKPYRQKGTGWARQGSIRAPNHVGGGIVFGPTPRKYIQKVNKKVSRKALKIALSQKAKDEKLVIVKDLKFGQIKTKAIDKMIKNFGNGKTLIVEDQNNRELVLSSRNLAKHKWLAPEGINVYDILNHDTLIMDEKTAKALDENLNKAVR